MSSFLQATFSLWQREVLRFARQRSRWIGALATPLLFWLLVGGGIGNSFQDGSGQTQGGYMSFFFPGALILSVMFTAIFSTLSVIEDRHQGFLQGVLVAPVSRASFVLAKMLGGASLGALQAGVLLLLAPFAGFHVGLMDVVEMMAMLFLIGAALTGLGFVFAWKLDSVQGYHSIMNMVLMPMWLLSGAVFSSKGASSKVYGWIQAINPLSYGVGVVKGILFHTVFVPEQLAWAVMFVFMAVMCALSFAIVENQRA